MGSGSGIEHAMRWLADRCCNILHGSRSFKAGKSFCMAAIDLQSL
jgi:hypothetical protein